MGDAAACMRGFCCKKSIYLKRKSIPLTGAWYMGVRSPDLTHATEIMNFPFQRWSAIRRKFPALLQVANTNLIENRRFQVKRMFVLFTYSILFKGKGFFVVDGRRYSLSAPCAFVAYPGEFIENGPTSPTDAWHHLYFDYEPKFIGRLEAMGLANKNNRVLPLGDLSHVWSLTEELCALSGRFPLESVVDRIDRLCEQIILESQLPWENETNEQRHIMRIQEKMQRAPHQPFDLAETARLCGMSTATFRRYWLKAVGLTPRRYHEQLRLQEACHKLVESALSIREISEKVGFRDEFYFSRRFRALIGVSPREYRKQHKI